MIYAVLSIWFAVALVATLSGGFAFAAGHLPLGFVVGILVPVVGFALFYAASAGFRRAVMKFDLRLVVMLHAFRVLGLVFITLWAVGKLPALFAWPAGLGDVAAGLAAPFVALYVLPRLEERRRSFIAWNVFGIADLVIAVTLGVLHAPGPLGLLSGGVQTGVMSVFPMALIPGFLVPLYILLHLVALARVAKSSEAVQARRIAYT